MSRRHPAALPADPLPPAAQRPNPLRLLLPYLAQYKGRIVVALTCLLLAKVAHVTVPIVLKWIVDDMKDLCTTPEFSSELSA